MKLTDYDLPLDEFEKIVEREIEAERKLMRNMLLTFALVVAAIILLTACETATPNRKRAEEAAFIAAEAGKKNDDLIYQKTATANQINFAKKKDLELAHDLDSLAAQSRLNPAKWDSLAIAAETVRLQTLHDSAIAAYAASQARNDALRVKNEQVNYGAMRKIRAALNPPKNDNKLLDQTDVIEATGATPQPPPLIQP